MTNLQRIRTESGLSQSKLSQMSDISVRTIQAYESGARSIDGAGIEVLVKLSDTLKVPISKLVESEWLSESIKNATL